VETTTDNELRRSSEQFRVDCLQAALGKLPAVECPLLHRFTPGLYTREIFMPAGTMVVSRIHKTEHPYAVLAGRALVWTADAGVVEIKAGHIGITTPGTRRVLLIAEDCRWVTFHPTSETDLAKLQDELTVTPDVTYAAGDLDALKILEQLQAAARLTLPAGRHGIEEKTS